MPHSNAHSTEQSILPLQAKHDAGLGAVARLGVIVLQTDQTIEHELRSLLSIDGVAWYHARIPNAMHVSAETLAQMATDLPAAAKLLPSDFDFDALAYACTSGALVIGEEAVAELVQETHTNKPVTNPLTACKAAFDALGLKKIGFLTPYSPQVSQAMRDHLAAAGYNLVTTASFYEDDDFKVGRISPDSICAAMKTMVAEHELDGIFVACTSLRVADLIVKAEAELGVAITSSNHALAWHLLRLAGHHQPIAGRGALWEV